VRGTVLTPHTVLLTGCGGAALPALIDGLRRKGCRTVGVDADPNAAGLYLVDRAYRVPFADDPAFASALRRICIAEDVAAVVPLVDEELLPAAGIAAELGIALIGPRPPFTALCLDKYSLMQALAVAAIPVPVTRLVRDGIGDMSFPVIVKPRVGRGSRGVQILASRRDWDEYLASMRVDQDAMLVQTFVEGPEFTVSTVVWRDGDVRAVVPKEVIDKRGITRVATTRRNSEIDTVCRAIQKQLRADGPFNVQLRLDSADGTPFIFEINPRFSTTITLTQSAGVDELGSLLDLAFGREPPAQAWHWQEDVTLIRRTVDAFIAGTQYKERRAALEILP
jgi:carbamoyl-phosphate synthase large subunit